MSRPTETPSTTEAPSPWFCWFREIRRLAAEHDRLAARQADGNTGAEGAVPPSTGDRLPKPASRPIDELLTDGRWAEARPEPQTAFGREVLRRAGVGGRS